MGKVKLSVVVVVTDNMSVVFCHQKKIKEKNPVLPFGILMEKQTFISKPSVMLAEIFRFFFFNPDVT